MDKIIYTNGRMIEILNSPLIHFIRILEDYTKKSIKSYQNKDTRMTYDYNIQIIKLEARSIWVRLNIFNIDYPNLTFTLLTLRCNPMLRFPILVEHLYSDDSNYSKDGVLICYTDEEFCSELEKLNFGLFQLINSINDYQEYSKDKEIMNETFGELIQEEKKNKRKNIPWSKEENLVFLGLIDEYREAIENKGEIEIKKITRDFAYEIKKDYEILLKDRTEQAIYEHLTYFDDLLAGVGEQGDYAIKDNEYFSTYARNNGSKNSNPARVKRSKKK